MGLLEEITGMMAGNGPAAAGGQPGSGISPALVQQVIAMLGGAGGTVAAGAPSGGLGGLGGLMAAFQRGGLANVFQSWVANGANLPITGAQLQQILGHGTLAQIAQSLGVDHASAAGGLAQILPNVVNHLTPTGQLPAGADEQAALQSLARQLMPR